MKRPRIADFDPSAAERELGSPLDDMPVIKPPAKKNTIQMPDIQKTRIPENQNAEKPEIQHPGEPAVKKSSMPENQTSRIPEPRPVVGQTTPMEKITFRFHAEGRYAVEDMKTALWRQCGIKASREQIAEEALLIISDDLNENGTASMLALRLSRKLESQKTS